MGGLGLGEAEVGGGDGFGWKGRGGGLGGKVQEGSWGEGCDCSSSFSWVGIRRADARTFRRDKSAPKQN